MEPNEAKELMKKIHEETYKIEVEVLGNGRLPCKAHATDAGWDLYAADDVVFEQGKITKHALEIKFKIPHGCYLEVKGKSGLGCKGLCLTAAIIDESYRGQPNIVGTCLVGEPLSIKKGQKIAQIIAYPYSLNYYMVQVDKVSEETDRGTDGFGSSGQ